MSLTTLYVRDSKNNFILVEVDVTGDPGEIGKKIKAAIANHEDEAENSPSVADAFPPLDLAFPPPAVEPSAERTGLAPGRRDGRKVASPNDVKRLNDLQEVRSEVTRWLSTSDIGDPEPTADEERQLQPTIKKEEEPSLNNVECHDSVKDSPLTAQKAFVFDEADGHGEHNESQPSLLTPEATPPTTAEGEPRPLTDGDFFSSAWEMAQDGEEHLQHQYREKPYPKRLDSTANLNTATYQQKFAEYDVISLKGTVGSKKTIESIYDGTSIKDLSLSENKSRERGATLTDKFRSLMPRRSSSKLSHKKKDPSPTDSAAEEVFADSYHKRALSINSLMPPENDSTPLYLTKTSADTNGYLTTTDRRASDAPDTSASTSPLNRLKRSFSKGEKRKSFTESGSTPHIVGLMRKEGGPPVSTALVSPLHEHSGGLEAYVPAPAVDDDDNDDEDDEYEDDGGADTDDVKGKVKDSHEDLSIQITPINPDQDGFRAHALQLNPRMEAYLADRIAQEQVRRYKELVGHKVRHEQETSRRACASGSRCLALGGQPCYVSDRSNSKGEKAQVFLVRGHFDAAETETNGATVASFQPGIPEPPVKQLPATFECSLCFKERTGVQKPSDWTKHVHEDLQPFTCTFKVCGTEKKSFKRKADWVRHENECHRHLEEWRCNYPECQHVCYRSDNFSQHLIREHKVPDFKEKSRGSTSSKIRARSITQNGQDDELIAKLHRICRSTSLARPESEPCPFCGFKSPSWKKHQVHLSKHMESIAMPVLGLVKQKEVSIDTVITPIKREQVQPLYQPKINSDMTATTTEAHVLTPYSTSGGSYHPGSSASESPLGPSVFLQGHAQYGPYQASSGSYHPSLYTSQSDMAGPQFVQQPTSSAIGGSTFRPLEYGTGLEHLVHVNNYHQNDSTLQAGSALYQDHPQMQFTAVNSTTPSTYPPANLRRSPAQNQLQPPTSYPMSNAMASHEYASSPHSGRSQYSSTTPSPHQMRALPTNHQLEIPRAQGMGNQMLPYSNGEYSNTYAFTEQQVPFVGSPMEAEPYSDVFHQSIEAQDYMVASAPLDFNAMAATTVPMGDTVYAVQQQQPPYRSYAGPPPAPHSQPYRYK